MENNVIRTKESKALNILGNSRRKAVIEILTDIGGEASVQEVVRRITLLETEEPSRKNRKSVYTSLTQNHLPKLSGAGLIEFNETEGVLRLHELPPEYKYHIEAVQKNDVPWCLVYLAISTFSMAISSYLSIYNPYSTNNIIMLATSTAVFLPALIHTSQTYHLLFKIKSTLHYVEYNLYDI